MVFVVEIRHYMITVGFLGIYRSIGTNVLPAYCVYKCFSHWIDGVGPIPSVDISPHRLLAGFPI